MNQYYSDDSHWTYAYRTRLHDAYEQWWDNKRSPSAISKFNKAASDFKLKYASMPKEQRDSSPDLHIRLEISSAQLSMAEDRALSLYGREFMYDFYVNAIVDSKIRPTCPLLSLILTANEKNRELSDELNAC
jgi:hypothetical protein